MIDNKILFKKTQFLKESWSYIAPTWEEMGQAGKRSQSIFNKIIYDYYR